jgi:anti-anti-sigma factor
MTTSTPAPDELTADEPWTITHHGQVATLQIRCNLEADDAFPLRRALSALTDAGCTELVFDLDDVSYIAHSAQAVIQDECKERKVTLRGINNRLRRVLRTDSVQLLDSVVEESAA